MMRYAVPCVFCTVTWVAIVSAQSPGSLTIREPSASIPISPLQSLQQFGRKEPERKVGHGFLKNLNIDTFGYSDLESSRAYTAAFYNFHGMECPLCLFGPVNRTGVSLPPFGASATLKLWHGRMELAGSSGALEAWRPEGTFQLSGRQPFTSFYGDAWLGQAEAEGRIAVDRNGHLWVGGGLSHSYNFAAGKYGFALGKRQWNTLSGNATFTFGH